MPEEERISNIAEFIDHFSDLKVAVIGDVMLDRYVRGDTYRISPEAPVPILKYKNEQAMLGGAGNVATNLADLNAKVFLFGSVGKDAHAKELIGIARDRGINCSGVIATDAAPTTYKERIVSRGQHVVRVDRELEENISTFTLDSLKLLTGKINKFDAIVVSDYVKGVMTTKIVSSLTRTVKKSKVPIIVDTKPTQIQKYKGVTLITPNEAEVLEAVGGSDPVKAAHILSKDLACPILLTRGAKGVHLVTDTESYAFDARVRDVVDVSGTGDTVSAVASAMLAAGSSLEEAVYTSNIAGGLAVCKLGTSSVSRSELIKAFIKQVPSSLKIHTLDSIIERVETEKADGEKIVLTNGCFDILHAGHIGSLEEARRQGNFLVVALNTDNMVKHLKGPARPVNKLENRMAVLAALSCVDAVISFDEDTAVAVINAIKPDVYVKGGDYSARKLLVMPEGKAMKKIGGKVCVTKDFKGHSTTNVVSRIIEAHRSDD
jgi:D-beta-D-heptose 7-phosphate kinase / D-beta-D-heptose 1-phosphate adenosyltransferase